MTAISCSPGASGHGPFCSSRTPTSLRTATGSRVRGLGNNFIRLPQCLSAQSMLQLLLGELRVENVLGLPWDATSAVSDWSGTKQLERGVFFKNNCLGRGQKAGGKNQLISIPPERSFLGKLYIKIRLLHPHRLWEGIANLLIWKKYFKNCKQTW